MKVSEIMTAGVRHCWMTDTLERAAQLMWEHDVGALPVLDAGGHVVAMVTDRDACMAAYTQGQPLRVISVMKAASHAIHSAHPSDSIEDVEAIMKMHRVRRVPVVDDGGNLVGMVSLGDIVQHARASQAPGALQVDVVAATLADVCRPHDLRRHPPETREVETGDAHP